MTGESPDWTKWHEAYDRPDSSLSLRLGLVQARIVDALDAARPGPIQVISICAGQGRDIIGVLAGGHPRTIDVRARLVELDPTNADYARETVMSAGLVEVEVVTGDASTTSAFEGAVPADLVLACGIFGNVSDEDIEHTIDVLPHLCAESATVIWTRHRREPDLTYEIRSWFARRGFVELGFDIHDKRWIGVGTHRLVAEAEPYLRDVRMFTFFGDGADAHS